MQIPVTLQQEPVAQNAEDIRTQRDVSDHIQVRIAPARLKQAAKWFVKITPAQNVEVGAGPRRLHQLLRGDAPADFSLKPRAKSGDGADGDRGTKQIDNGGRW